MVCPVLAVTVAVSAAAADKLINVQSKLSLIAIDPESELPSICAPVGNVIATVAPDA
jgi:hypothetical protein